ncbi:MAG: hypothetical protein J6O41_07655 [Clostridia bacterium]|nr:hypothetical protein [Clostridia bacterium]
MNNKKKKKNSNKNNSKALVKKPKNNVIKLKTSNESRNLIHTNKLRISLIIIILIFALLIGRIGYLQFVQGDYLKELTYNQQTINQIISPKRGNIYDSTGKSLAISAQVDTITINPTKLVKNSDSETKDYKEKIARRII